MPYIEDEAIFDQLVKDRDVWWSDARNQSLITSWQPAYMFCPSSDLPTRITVDNLDNMNPNNADHPMPMYVGIAGATDGDVNSPVFGEVVEGRRGIGGRNGILFDQTSVAARQITDGASNTLLLAEQSDWGIQESLPNPRDIRSTVTGGPFICHCHASWASMRRGVTVPLKKLAGTDFWFIRLKRR